MPLESATTISELYSNYPLGGDVVSQGDDHLRLLKAVLKSQFPGALGAGLAAPVNVSEVEFGYLVGVTSSIQDQFGVINTKLGELNAPTGTRLAFHQASPPTGWTQDITVTDSMLRVVSGAGGATGGIDSPINFTTEHYHTTGDHQLTIAEMPSHRHEIIMTTLNPGSTAPFNGSSGIDTEHTEMEGGDGAHNHGDTNSTGATVEFKYHDMIICAKE